MAAPATASRAAAPARPRKRPALAAAPAPKAPPRKAPARRAPARKPSPARRQAPSRHGAGQLIPLAVGTAGAVRRLPDSSLMVRLTRGRAWIGVLGVLLVGIVALNVLTLSFAASSGHIAQNIQALEEDNSVARSRDAHRSGAGLIHREAAELGLTATSADGVGEVRVGPHDVATAASRLAAAETAY